MAALRPIHCSNTTNANEIKPVVDGLWTTLVGTASKQDMSKLISKSKTCNKYVLPRIVKNKVKAYENSQANQVRSIRVLYEGGIMSKRKYTSIRNCTDVVKEEETSRKNEKTLFLKGCEVPKIVNYQRLMKVIHSIDIGKVLEFETLATTLSVAPVPGVYRPLKPFLLELADLYLLLNEKRPCLHWFNDESMVFYVALGADGAPFGRDETATGNEYKIFDLEHSSYVKIIFLNV